jgi:hypothetical protein
MSRYRLLSCSFCGKNERDVERLIAGPKVHICDACVDACIEILGEERAWCDKQVANLERLRAKSSTHPPASAPQASEPDGWIDRLLGRTRRNRSESLH